MQIVPAIIAKNFTELEKKVKLVEPYVETVQLDIMDGVFVPNITWSYFEGQSIADLARLETNLFIEAHLMVAEPENIIDAWLGSKVKRVIVHYEAVKKISNFQFLISNLAQRTHQANKEFGIALNLETPIEVLEPYFPSPQMRGGQGGVLNIDTVLLMAVNPGFSGQKFQEEVIHKAETLRQKHGNVKMGIDGGINQNTAKKLDSVKVDFLAVGSAIFESGDVKKAIYEMKNL